MDVENSLACCKDWTLNFEKNEQAIDSFKIKDSTSGTSASSTLPSWLQQYKNEKSRDSLHHKVRNLQLFVLTRKQFCGLLYTAQIIIFFIKTKKFICFLSFLCSRRIVSVSRIFARNGVHSAVLPMRIVTERRPNSPRFHLPRQPRSLHLKETRASFRAI